MSQLRQIKNIHESLCSSTKRFGNLYNYQLHNQIEHCLLGSHKEKAMMIIDDPIFQADQKRLENGIYLRHKDLKLVLSYCLFSDQGMDTCFSQLQKIEENIQSQKSALSFSMSNIQLDQKNRNGLQLLLSTLPEKERFLILMKLLQSEYQRTESCILLFQLYEKVISAICIQETVAIEWFVNWLTTPNLIAYISKLKLVETDELVKEITSYRSRFSKFDWLYLLFSWSSNSIKLDLQLLPEFSTPIQKRIQLVGHMLRVHDYTSEWGNQSYVVPILQHIALDTENHAKWRNSNIYSLLEILSDYSYSDEAKYWPEIFEAILVEDAFSLENVRKICRIGDISFSIWLCQHTGYCDADIVQALSKAKDLSVFLFFLKIDSEIAWKYYSSKTDTRFQLNCNKAFVLSLPQEEAWKACFALTDHNALIECALKLFEKEEENKQRHAQNIVLFVNSCTQTITDKNRSALSQFLRVHLSLFQDEKDLAFACVDTWPMWEPMRSQLKIMGSKYFQEERWNSWKQEPEDSSLQEYLDWEQIRMDQFDWNQKTKAVPFRKSLSPIFTTEIKKIFGPLWKGSELYQRMLTGDYIEPSELIPLIEKHNCHEQVNALLKNTSYTLCSVSISFFAQYDPEQLLQRLLKTKEVHTSQLPYWTTSQKITYFQNRLQKDPKNTYYLSMLAAYDEHSSVIIEQNILSIKEEKRLPSIPILKLFFSRLATLAPTRSIELLKKVSIQNGKYECLVEIADVFYSNDNMVGVQELYAMAKRKDIRRKVEHYMAMFESKKGNWEPLLDFTDNVFEEIPGDIIDTLWVAVEKCLCRRSEIHWLNIVGFSHWAIEYLDFPQTCMRLRNLCSQSKIQFRLPDIFQELYILFEHYSAAHLEECRQLYLDIKALCSFDDCTIGTFLERIKIALLLKMPLEIQENVLPIQQSFVAEELTFVAEELKVLAHTFPAYRSLLLLEEERHELDWQVVLQDIKPRKLNSILPSLQDIARLDAKVASLIFQHAFQCLKENPDTRWKFVFLEAILGLGAIANCDLSFVLDFVDTHSENIDFSRLSFDLCTILENKGYYKELRYVLTKRTEEHIRSSEYGNIWAKWLSLYIKADATDMIADYWLKEVRWDQAKDYLDMEIPSKLQRSLHFSIFRNKFYDLWTKVMHLYIDANQFMELQELLLSTVQGKDWMHVMVPLQRKLMRKKALIPLKKTFLYGDDRPFLRDTARFSMLILMCQEDSSLLESRFLEEQIF